LKFGICNLIRPRVQLFLDVQRVPKFAQSSGKLFSVRPVLHQHKLIGQVLKRRNDFLSQPFQPVGKSDIVGDLNRALPRRAFPTAGERFVFELVQLRFFGGHEPGLERGEEIVVRPVERGDAQRAARQFRERVMRNRFAAVEKKRNVVAGKDPLQNLMITFKRADNHARLAKASAGADETQNLAGGERGFGFGVRADGDAEAGGELRT